VLARRLARSKKLRTALWPRDGPTNTIPCLTTCQLAQDPRGKDLLRSLETVLKPEQIARARQRASSLLLEREQQLSAKAFAQ
jgi:hypothetical protein